MNKKRALQKGNKKERQSKACRSMLALPIFPGRHQPSIVGRNELNYRVRNGNGWTLVLISTNYVIRVTGEQTHYTLFACACQASFKSNISCLICGDPYRIRTDVNGVRGRCLNHLTNGPHRWHKLHSARFRLRQKLTPFRCAASSNRTRFAGLRLDTFYLPIRGVPALSTPRTGLVHLHGLEPGTH